MSIVVGIDASRNRSGGARSHVIGLLTKAAPHAQGIREVHLWAYRSLLDEIPDAPWLVKHSPVHLDSSLPRQLWWQAFRLAEEARTSGCEVLFATDASTLCTFNPMVVMSQDMLPYEPGEMRRLGVGIRRMRHIALATIQNRALRKASGIIFLTEYAANSIQAVLGPLRNASTIPHGINPCFFEIISARAWPRNRDEPLRLLYISNAAPYKHNWIVVKATELLRARGHNVTLRLVGGGKGEAQRLLDRQIAASDPHRHYVEQMPFVSHQLIPSLLADAHIFVFASSCENMPVTLLEAMAVGLPIACSNRGPMPEILGSGGTYFDPEDHISIAAAIESVINNPQTRFGAASVARSRATQFTWEDCATRTFSFLATIARPRGEAHANDRA